MDDTILPFHSNDIGVHGFICLTTELTNEASRRHKTSPTASAALARVLTAAALLSGTVKPRHRVALKFEGTGPFGTIIAEATGSGRIRGYVGNPKADPPLIEGNPDIITGLGRAGLLTVVKDRQSQLPQKTVVHLATSEIQGDLQSYLEQSENTPSHVELVSEGNESGFITAAGGLLIQAVEPELTTGLAKLHEYLQELPPLSSLFKSGHSLSEILDLIFSGIDYQTRGDRPLLFHCSCSRERSRFALITLGSEGVQEILDKEGEAVIDCHFCHERYVFTREELEALIEELNSRTQ